MQNNAKEGGRANARVVRCMGLQAYHIPAFMGSLIALGVHHGMSVSTVQRCSCKRLMPVDTCVPYTFVEIREAYKLRHIANKIR